MITLHHLGRPHKLFALNRDLIMAVEASPDTVITLTTGDRLLVSETPEAVVELVREGRVEVLTQALARRDGEHLPRPHGHVRHRSDAPLTVISPIDSQRDNRCP